jgi:alkanesulfonate monooxygenase SsuD/methylene tetrahydromethanopterin reductase-like flavin-dependent oxidoreductase (luciferase family)
VDTVIYDIQINPTTLCPVPEIVDLSPLMEQAGFGAFWKGESNHTDPLVFCCAIAARTRKLKVGTGIYHIYGRSAVTMGIQAATLQDMSGGRFLLGLGVANKTIAGWHGGTFDRPLRRIREYMEIVRKTAAGEKVEYKGEIYNTGQRFQLSWRPEHPTFPIYIAGLGPKMTRLAGEIADGVVINMATPAKVREIAGRVREGAAAAGRDPGKLEIIAKVWVSLNPRREAARSNLRQLLTFYNIADHYKEMLISSGFEPEVTAVQEAFRKGGFKAAREQMSDEYMDRLPAIPGTSIGEIKERLKPFEEAGVTRLILPYVPGEEPAIEDARRFLEAWGKNS